MSGGEPQDAGEAGSTPVPSQPVATHPLDRLADPERVKALSDGVFAIVLTILVLEVTVPEVTVPEDLAGLSLRSALGELRPTLVAWVISFLIVGMYCVAHRDMFCRVLIVNRDVVWLNLLPLVPVSLIPLAASVLGTYPEEPVALLLYGVVMIAATVMRPALYWYLVRRPKLLWPRRVDRPGLVGSRDLGHPDPGPRPGHGRRRHLGLAQRHALLRSPRLVLPPHHRAARTAGDKAEVDGFS